jgi:hypothetical protein
VEAGRRAKRWAFALRDLQDRTGLEEPNANHLKFEELNDKIDQ